VVDRDIDGIVERCRDYWLETRVPQHAVDDMATELADHLTDAAAEGKAPETVIGDDVLAFAEAWAREHRAAAAARRPRSAAPMARPDRPRPWVGLGLVAAGAAAVIAALIAGPKEEAMDTETMQWVWVGATVVLAVGEIATAGFFLLPFAAGAAVAAILAFAGVAVPLQFLVMIAVSILTLVLLQRYVRKEDERQPVIGANRYVTRTALVLEPINRANGTGRVRLDTEVWRATTDQPDIIPPGAEVQIVEVRGTRLVVDPFDE
jgi:membrane protein implicated in regulation of membrane protease activity